MRKLRIAGICAAVVLVLALVVYAETPTDLDITKFSAPPKVKVGEAIGLGITIANNGDGDAPGTLHIVGEQNGVGFVHQVLEVQVAPGKSEKIALQSYLAQDDGVIIWTAYIMDGDPDLDEATDTTDVVGDTVHDKVEVCHILPNGNQITLVIDSHALDAHLAQGDTEGPCAAPAACPCFTAAEAQVSIDWAGGTCGLTTNNPPAKVSGAANNGLPFPNDKVASFNGQGPSYCTYSEIAGGVAVKSVIKADLTAEEVAACQAIILDKCS